VLAHSNIDAATRLDADGWIAGTRTVARSGFADENLTEGVETWNSSNREFRAREKAAGSGFEIPEISRRPPVEIPVEFADEAEPSPVVSFHRDEHTASIGRVDP
jgi:hypothetical protein